MPPIFNTPRNPVDSETDRSLSGTQAGRIVNRQSQGVRFIMVSLERMAHGRLHYSWIVAAITFVTLLAAAGIRATPGVLIVPLEQEFGWTRASISVAVSVNLVLYGFLGPFSAALVDRLGAR